MVWISASPVFGGKPGYLGFAEHVGFQKMVLVHDDGAMLVHMLVLCVDRKVSESCALPVGHNTSSLTLHLTERILY